MQGESEWRKINVDSRFCHTETEGKFWGLKSEWYLKMEGLQMGKRTREREIGVEHIARKLAPRNRFLYTVCASAIPGSHHPPGWTPWSLLRMASNLHTNQQGPGESSTSVLAGATAMAPHHSNDRDTLWVHSLGSFGTFRVLGHGSSTTHPPTFSCSVR